jgi:hypothetical protein
MWLAILSIAFAREPTPTPVPCRLPEDAGIAILSRRIDGFRASKERLDAVVDRLREGHRVPLSYIADEPGQVSFSEPTTTLKAVLDAIVAQVPAYRYAVVREHLMLFPKAKAYDEVLDLPPAKGPRLQMASKQIEAITAGYAAFKDLVPPPLLGDPQHFLYQDEVSLGGKGTLVEHLADLLGRRDVAFFSFYKKDWGVRAMLLDMVPPFAELKVEPKRVEKMEVGHSVQLSVIAVMHDGSTWVLTRPECGTQFFSPKPAIARVSAEGRVTALSPGSALVMATNANRAAAAVFTIVAPVPVSRTVPLLGKNDARLAKGSEALTKVEVSAELREQFTDGVALDVVIVNRGLHPIKIYDPDHQRLIRLTIWDSASSFIETDYGLRSAMIIDRHPRRGEPRDMPQYVVLSPGRPLRIPLRVRQHYETPTSGTLVSFRPGPYRVSVSCHLLTPAQPPGSRVLESDAIDTWIGPRTRP